PAGKAGRQVNLGGVGASMRHVLLGRFSDGTFLARNNMVGRANSRTNANKGAGPRRDSIPWLRLREDGVVLDTLVKAPAEVYDNPTANAVRVYRFTPRPAVLVDGDHF